MSGADRRMLFYMLGKVSKDMDMTGTANIHARELQKELALVILTEKGAS